MKGSCVPVVLARTTMQIAEVRQRELIDSSYDNLVSKL